MKILFKSIVFLTAAFLSASCYDESKLPFPEFIEGASLRALPSPWTARPAFSLANPSAPYVLNLSSYNETSLSKVDIFVSYLPNTAVPAAAGTGTYANFVAPVGTAGWIPEVPASGSAPITISYSRYDGLIKGQNASTGATFTPLPKTLFRTLSGQIVGDLSFTLSELATAAGVTLPATVPPSTTTTNLGNQPAFILIFEVTMNDGAVYSYINSGPGVTANPATGRVAARGFTGTDISGAPVTNKPYSIILSGAEGSPFLPGISIRIAP
jgi:hypothetical protein